MNYRDVVSLNRILYLYNNYAATILHVYYILQDALTMNRLCLGFSIALYKPGMQGEII
jgi:hypothetical protein